MTQSADYNSVLNNAECIINSEQIEQILRRLAQSITKDLAACNPVLLCVMNGGLMFTAGLGAKLDFPLQMGYLHATRYRGQIEGQEALTWPVPVPEALIKDRHVLILDDIYDEGATLIAIKQACMGLAKTVKIAVLLDKQHNRKADVNFQLDYIGSQCPDRYVFGYGMDYKEYGRNLPAIYACSPS